MPRLLLLCEYPTVAGGERSMLSTLESVRSAGFDPVVAAPPSGSLGEELERRGVVHRPLTITRERTQQESLAAPRQQLAQVMDEVSPQLVHANSLSMGRFAGPVVAEKRIPSLAHLRDIVRLSDQAVRDLNGHNRLLAVSHATRDYHLAQGLSPTKTCVVYNGVDLATFCPRRSTNFLSRELGLPAEAPIVGAIGQISLRKGTDLLMDVARRVMAHHRDVHWVVVGSRYSSKAEAHQVEADARSAAAQSEWGGRVHFLGFRDDISNILNELTVLIHLARQEPLGRVLLEAAASGLAIVATDVGGTQEIFPHPLRAACLVPPDEPEVSARAIERLLGDSAERARLGVAARQRAVEMFDVRKAASALTDEYQRVLLLG